MINKKTFSSGGILSHCCCFICPGLKSTFLGLLPPSQYFEKKKSTKTPAATFLAGGEDTCGRDLTDEYLELFLDLRDRAGIKKKNWFSFPLLWLIVIIPDMVLTLRLLDQAVRKGKDYHSCHRTETSVSHAPCGVLLNPIKDDSDIKVNI